VGKNYTPRLKRLKRCKTSLATNKGPNPQLRTPLNYCWVKSCPSHVPNSTLCPEERGVNSLIIINKIFGHSRVGERGLAETSSEQAVEEIKITDTTIVQVYGPGCRARLVVGFAVGTSQRTSISCRRGSSGGATMGW